MEAGIERRIGATAHRRRNPGETTAPVVWVIAPPSYQR
jgi:hypothetical protein